MLPLAVLVKLWKGCALVYDPHELETETAGLHGVRQSVARTVERCLIGFADAVCVVNRSIEAWYVARYRLKKVWVVRKHDLLDLCAQAIGFWVLQIGITAEPLAIADAPNDFNPMVVLYFDARYQVNMQAVRLRFFKRHEDGRLYPVAPVDCPVEILKAELLQRPVNT